MVALSAAEFTGSLGVNTHLEYLDTAYGDITKVEAALRYLGVGRLREITPLRFTASAMTLAAKGYGFDFVVREADGKADLDQTLAMVTQFATQYPGSVKSIEGLNEANFWGVAYKGLAGLPAAAQVQRDLYRRAKQAPSLLDIPIINLSLGGVGADAYQPLGDLSKAADLGNAHVYWGHGRPPATAWPDVLRAQNTSTPRLTRMAMTETGYSTAKKASGGVDETVQAKYILDLLMDAAKHGIENMYIYELSDEKPDPKQQEREHGFGLFRADWSPKPSAVGIHNLLLLLGQGGQARVRPLGMLSLGLAGLPASASSLLFEDADGVFDLVVWAEPAIWDPLLMAPIQAASHPIRLVLASVYDSVLVYDPLLGADPIGGGAHPDKVSFALTDHPIVIKIGKVSHDPAGL
jgi:hypothetical protein